MCKLTFDNGSYEGETNGFHNRHGHGKTTFDHGDTYEGQYKDNKRRGLGKYTWKTPKNLEPIYYEGQWENDEQSGHGKQIHANGAVYEGEFKDGKPVDTPGFLFVLFRNQIYASLFVIVISFFLFDMIWALILGITFAITALVNIAVKSPKEAEDFNGAVVIGLPTLIISYLIFGWKWMIILGIVGFFVFAAIHGKSEDKDKSEDKIKKK